MSHNLWWFLFWEHRFLSLYLFSQHLFYFLFFIYILNFFFPSHIQVSADPVGNGVNALSSLAPGVKPLNQNWWCFYDLFFFKSKQIPSSVAFPSTAQSTVTSTLSSVSLVPDREDALDDCELMGEDLDSLLDCFPAEPEPTKVKYEPNVWQLFVCTVTSLIELIQLKHYTWCSSICYLISANIHQTLHIWSGSVVLLLLLFFLIIITPLSFSLFSGSFLSPQQDVHTHGSLCPSRTNPPATPGLLQLVCEPT